MAAYVLLADSVSLCSQKPITEPTKVSNAAHAMIWFVGPTLPQASHETCSTP